ncbi:MAG: trehalose-phosphatase [Thermodesulfobacteriota bacterium]
MKALTENLRRVWIFDFDGTLSPIVAERSAARMLPEAKKTLTELNHLPGQQVAVLSSRMLDDLISRVRVPGTYLGGGSGIEWLLPDGRRTRAEESLEPLLKAREATIPRIDYLKAIPGVDVEDKTWSVAVHVRRVMQDDRASVFGLLTDMARTGSIRILKGPEVFEIQLLPEIDKLLGVRALCRLIRFDPGSGMIVYCGDDENDAVAMEWVIRQGGVAFSIGFHPLVPGARPVDGPEGLVREIRKWACMGKGEVRRKHERL